MTESTTELLTVQEVSDKLRVDSTTTRRWIKNGILDAIALPHRNTRQAYRIRSETLAKLLETTTAVNS
jgi:excisionase family DNA binding protein